MIAIKTALKQENLNPEIEEKLLQLQRYQERQIKQGKQDVMVGSSPAPIVATSAVTPTSSRPSQSKKRPATVLTSPTDTTVPTKDPPWEPSRKRSNNKTNAAEAKDAK
jgi:nucleosome-remodeling factor subunit BPTF